jgi:ribulose 1,5-bisphosphate synthetase/thiazole synthase
MRGSVGRRPGAAALNQWVMDVGWDCIVASAGAAGLSAALVLGRARRRTLVIDAGEQSNPVAHGAGAIAAGSQAATMLVQSLLADEFGLPFPAKGSRAGVSQLEARRTP